MSEQKSVEANTIKASLSDSDVSFSSSANAPPVVQVTELSDGLYHIKCAFKISDPDDLGWGIQEETFQLDNYSSCCPFYKLTLMCHHRDPQPDQCESSPNPKFAINLKLTRVACPSSQCLISKNNNDKSAAVWAQIGRRQKFILEPLSNIFYQSVGEINAHKQFTNLFRNQLNCDVTFNFDEIEEDESIGGHAIILSARSSVFAAMFQCGMREANTRKVCIKDIKPDIFKQLLHYIYSEAALDFVESHGKEICHQDDWERLMKNYPDLCLLATRRITTGELNTQMQFVNMYVNQLNCDVTFHFDTAEKDESIGAHVSILSARSSVFAALFQSGMQETSTRKICIKDIKPDIFKQLLHYVYSGRLSTKLSEEIAQPLFVAADMYDVDDLKTECVRFLLSCIKLENAINLMAWAHIHSIDSLKEAALDFVGSHGKEICQQEGWERLIKSYPDLCLLATRRMWK
ncbi:hypothetical protein GHT06_010601 [Daphnia sinensis]|uniref:BTB domain-containing protein n=1 Tax=Daphnia sinensis TaxID=1820382 RepID=A0AAD5Q0J1_9CRUS|nr:hypothetical protein GHT06_010601 [Daphnia sinensis]